MPASTPESIDEVAFDANDLHRLIGRLDHPLGLAHNPPECSPPSRDASIEGVVLAAEETLEAIGIECNFIDRRRR